MFSGVGIHRDLDHPNRTPGEVSIRASRAHNPEDLLGFHELLSGDVKPLRGSLLNQGHTFSFNESLIILFLFNETRMILRLLCDSG